MHFTNQLEILPRKVWDRISIWNREMLFNAPSTISLKRFVEMELGLLCMRWGH